jgi:triacylglycerol lipase
MSVVFAAGFLVPQHVGPANYFRGVANAFPGSFFPGVPPVADVVTRATALAAAINGALPNGPIHIVAHSMAGLDSRFLLSKNLLGLANPGRVVSLSMISTPHLGSPIADLLVGPRPDAIDRRLAYDMLMHLAGELGQSLGALGDLTSGFTAGFNPQNPNVGTVKYFSYAGAGAALSLLMPSRAYINLVGQTSEDKANDGMVSVKSASWTPLAEGPWPTDHLGEVGYDLTFDHLTAYRRILARAGA